MRAEYDIGHLELIADTDDEIELIRAIAGAVANGGTVEVRGVMALEFDGDMNVIEPRKTKKPRRQRHAT